MKTHRRVTGILLVGLLGVVCAGVVEPAERPGLVLFSPQEAKRLDLTGEQWPPNVLTRSLPRGPRVVVRHPDAVDTNDGPAIQTGSPTAFVVSFEQNQAPVDMESLEIRAKKGIFSKSLTDRLRPYLHGTSIEADAVNVPEGRFVIQIEIADRSGAKTVKSYRLEVKNQ